jgi:hypothetical protein
MKIEIVTRPGFYSGHDIGDRHQSFVSSVIISRGNGGAPRRNDSSNSSMLSLRQTFRLHAGHCLGAGDT